MRTDDAPRRTDRHPPPAGQGRQVPHREPRQEPRLHRLPRHQPRRPAASTPSPSAASTSATTPAPAPTSRPTPSAPASTSRPCSTASRTTLPAAPPAAARPPSPARRSTSHYGEQLRLGLHLPPRHSDQLGRARQAVLRRQGAAGPAGGAYDDLIAAVEAVPEEVTVFSDAHGLHRPRDRARARWLAAKQELARASSNAGHARPRNLLKVPLYDYQTRGALFLACRGRCILGDDMGLGKTVQTLAAVELLARERGIAPGAGRRPGVGEVPVGGRDPQVHRPAGAGDRGRHQDAREAQYAQPTLLPPGQLRAGGPRPATRSTPGSRTWSSSTRPSGSRTGSRRPRGRSRSSRSRYALVLTGTPLENKLEELYSIVQFVDDRRLGPAFQFLHDHRVLDDKGNLIGYRNLDTIREKLAPIFLRRTRAEVLGQLPGADRQHRLRRADRRAARRPTRSSRPTLARLLGKTYLTDLDRKRILACLANMRMLCDSTFLFDKQTNVSPKLDEFAELIAELMSIRRPQGGRLQPVGDDAAQGGRGARPARRRLRAAARRHAGQGPQGGAGAVPAPTRPAACS